MRSTRVRFRLAAAVLAGAVAVTALAGCGKESDKDDDGSSQSATEGGSDESPSDESPSEGASEDPSILDDVDVQGDFGSKPTVDFKALDPKALVSRDIEAGDGAKVAEGDQVFINLWIANAKTTDEAFDSFKTGAEMVTADPSMLPPFILDGITDRTVGSRTLLAAPAKDAYGDQGNEQLKIGPNEPVLVVVDVVSRVLDGPEGQDEEPASWAPEVVETDGVPSSLKFGDGEPADDLQVTTLVKGEGDEVASGDKIVVNYLGQVPGSDKPFDASFGREPFQFALGQGQVVKGWDQGLEGVTVGSRVILSIPPSLGYGKQGQGDIKGTDTMYFVVDVLGAS